MTSPAANQIPAQVEAVFGAGIPWASPSNTSAVAWEKPGYHLIWSDEVAGETEIRRLWEDRKGRQAYSVVLLAPAGNPGNVQVAGPQDARPVRELPAGRVLDLLQTASSMTARQATSFLAREFGRLEDAVVPGLKVKDLLTPHFARERLRWPVNASRLASALGKTPPTGGIAWRSLFQGMGYQVDQLPKRGYLLRHEGAPVAVVHPYQDPSQLGGLTENEALPEGLVLNDCEQYGTQWGILEATGRYRLFQRKPPVGPATGQYLEIDTSELDREDRLYLGLFAPESLREGGWLTEWVTEAKDFGDELRRGLEDRLVRIALPRIAQGLGEFLQAQGADLGDREQLGEIEEAALTLVFRYMFLLHTEARGYLPIGSPTYRSQSAVQLAEDTLRNLSSLDGRSTQRWDRLGTLVQMVRSGDRSSGVPAAYNGSLFAADGFPGSALLERAKLTDNYLGPAIVSIAHEGDNPDSPGLDFAGLQIDHLGSIYESLLALRLSRAPEDLVYDTKSGAKGGAFRPRRSGDTGETEVAKAQLYYQSEVGGRKAGGVFYTRREFVEHLLHHSLSPALEDHLDEVRRVAKTNPSEAARRLFDFSVVDPAMGSAHFLTSALYMIADRMDTFLAEVEGLPGIAQQLSELTQEVAHASNPPDAADLLRRLILKRCIYGVDISPMAVEVANVTLWLASFVPGLALSYLGSNLKCGDALIGVADPHVVGASDSPLLTGQPVEAAMRRAAELQGQLADIPDRTPEEVKRSEKLNADLIDATDTTSSGLILDPEAEPSAVRLAALLKANPKFQRSWDQNRRDMKDPSPSGYNMSMADIAIRAGWPDQEVVNLLICWRRIHGHDLKLRERYYDLTLTRAKEPIQMEREQEKLEETLTHPPEDEPEVLKDRLDKLFKVDIIRIVKYLGNPPDFYMYTEQGDISIGPIANLASQPKFREAVMAATKIVIPKVSGAVWETRVQAILSLCEDEDLGEASHPEDETRTWVHDYLIERHVRSEDEWEKAAQRRFPFIKWGRIRIFRDDFGRWLDTNLGRKLDINTLAQGLKRIKAAPERIHIQVGGARTTRSVWVLPEIFQPPVVGTDPEDDGPDAAPAGRNQPEAAPPEQEGTDATPSGEGGRNGPESKPPDGGGTDAAPAGEGGQNSPESKPRDGGGTDAKPPDGEGPGAKPPDGGDQDVTTDATRADAGVDNGFPVIQEDSPEHEKPPG